MTLKDFLKKLKFACGDEAFDLVEDFQLGRISTLDFDDWWDDIGSGIAPEKGEDKEEHTKRVCKTLYSTLYDQG